MIVSPATTDHLVEIRDLAGLIWRAHYPGIISLEQIEYMLARMYDLDVLASELRGGMTYFRALAGDALVGFASTGPVKPVSGAEQESVTFKLHKLYVHPGHQRVGVGAALLEAVRNHARAHGATALVLNVNKRNAKAIAMYQKHGFVLAGSVVVDIGNGFVMDDFVMKQTFPSTSV